MHETWVQSLGQENSLEKGVATHSSILAWRIPWTEEPGEFQRVGYDCLTLSLLSIIYIQNTLYKYKYIYTHMYFGQKNVKAVMHTCISS